MAELVWLDPDGIVDGIPKPLLASQIALCGLYTDVPEQKLNLFQFSARFVAQAGARATKVVGRHGGEVTSSAGFLHHAPDHLRAEAVRGNSARLVDCAKDRTNCDLRFPRAMHANLFRSRTERARS